MQPTATAHTVRAEPRQLTVTQRSLLVTVGCCLCGALHLGGRTLQRWVRCSRTTATATARSVTAASVFRPAPGWPYTAVLPTAQYAGWALQRCGRALSRFLSAAEAGVLRQALLRDGDGPQAGAAGAPCAADESDAAAHGRRGFVGGGGRVG